MATIRCPHCGMLNHADDFSYPRCGQCHEDLVRCNDCRSFEGGTCTHPRAFVRFSEDLEAAKSCPAFRSRYEERDPRLFINLPAPLWMFFLLMLIIGALGLATLYIDPGMRYFRGNPLQLRADVPAQVIVGQPLHAHFRVTNQLSKDSTRIYLEIDQEYLSAAAFVSARPSPRRIAAGPEQLILEYGPIGPHAQLPIQLTFVQRKRGVATFVARIYAPSSRLLREVRAPIAALGVVLPEPAPGGNS